MALRPHAASLASLLAPGVHLELKESPRAVIAQALTAIVVAESTGDGDFEAISREIDIIQENMSLADLGPEDIGLTKERWAALRRVK